LPPPIKVAVGVLIYPVPELIILIPEIWRAPMYTSAVAVVPPGKSGGEIIIVGTSV